MKKSLRKNGHHARQKERKVFEMRCLVAELRRGGDRQVILDPKLARKNYDPRNDLCKITCKYQCRPRGQK